MPAKSKTKPPARKHQLRPGEKRDKTTEDRAFNVRQKEPIWVPVFLDCLSKYGLVTEACRVSGVSSEQAYAYRREHDSFTLRWNQALEKACDALEIEAQRRAVIGVTEEVYGNLGKDEGGRTGIVGKRKKYSDQLLIFLLKGNRPKKFREDQGTTAEQGPGKGYINISPDDWDHPSPPGGTGNAGTASDTAGGTG